MRNQKSETNAVSRFRRSLRASEPKADFGFPLSPFLPMDSTATVPLQSPPSGESLVQGVFMRPPLKLSAIDQEHLQELYNEAGIARDELPYSPAFDGLCQGFQDRTFKNAHAEQVYSALLKYVRSSTNSAGEVPATTLNDEQIKMLKAVLPRHAKGSKLTPYSDEFEAAHKEYNKLAGLELTSGEFWRAILHSQGPRRRPPKRAKVAAPVVDDDDGDIE
jgi:hypothetical protein